MNYVRALRLFSLLLLFVVTTATFAQTFTPELTPTAVTVTAGGAGATFQAAINHDPGFNSSIRVFFDVVPFGLTIAPSEQFLNPPYNAVTFTVFAQPHVAAGAYDVGVVFSSTETKRTTLRVNVIAAPTPPGFVINVVPNTLDVRQGESQTATVSVTAREGFSGTVTLRNDADPTRLEVTPATFALTLATNGTASQPITIRARPGATPGPTQFYIYGQSGTVMDSAPVSVNVTAGPAPEFTIAVAAPQPVSVPQGGATTFRITASGTNGFNAPINVQLTPSSGVTVDPASFTMNAGETREITATIATNAPVGAASVGVVATSGTLQRTGSATFTILSAAQPDFALNVAGPNPPSIRPGETSRMTVTVTPAGGFNAPVTVEVQAPAGVTPSERTFTLAPGAYTREITLTAGAAASGAQMIAIRATSGTLQRTASGAITVVPLPAGTAPVIQAVSPELTTPTPAQTVYLIGQNFLPGAVVLSQTAGVVVEGAVVRTPTLIEATILVRGGVTPGGYRLDVRNPDGGMSRDGGRLVIRDSSDLGAALGVTTAAILYPVEGTIIANGEAVYPRALLATTGTGTVTGYWALDGVRFDSFTATVAGGRLVASVGRCNPEAGLAAQVCTNVPVPPLTWGPSHRLELVIETPRKAASPAVTVIGSPDSATGMTTYEPAAGAEIGDTPARFSWTLVPGATGYELEFMQGEGENARVVGFRTTRAEWVPRKKDLQRLGLGSFVWRVRAIRTGEVRDEPTPWSAVTIRANAIAMKLGEVASVTQDIPMPVPDPAVESAPPAVATTYALAPNATITAGSGQDVSARAQLSSQGELGGSAANSKFTGDLSYGAGFDPNRVVQESRNWLIEAGTPLDPASVRPGGDLRLGYTTPDFTDGAEFLTSGVARTGVIARARSRFGTLSYYQPVETAVHGVLSGNPENLDIQSLALSTPDGRPYSIRLIGLQVEEPDDDFAGTMGSRLRTLGIFSRYDVSPRLGIVAEVARGKVEATTAPMPSRNGIAFRLGLTGTAAGVNYGFNVRSIDAHFVNPANRGLTPGGVTDRVAVALNLGKSIGRTSLNFTAQRQEQGHSDDSTLPATDQTTFTAGISTFVRSAGVNLSMNWTGDRGEGDANAFLPETEREMAGLTASFSETVGRFSLSQSLSVQRMSDANNPMADQDMTNVNLSGSGALFTNVTLSASAGATRTEADPALGTTDSVTLSLQPMISIPAASVTLQPSISLSTSRNPTTSSDTETKGYQAIVMWSPTWLGSLVGAQVSASWNQAAFGGVEQPMTRTYQGSLTFRMNKTKGMPLFAAGGQ